MMKTNHKLTPHILRLFCNGVDAEKRSKNNKSYTYETLHFTDMDGQRYITPIDSSFKNAPKWKQALELARDGYNYAVSITDPKFVECKQFGVKQLNADFGPDPILKENIWQESPNKDRLKKQKQIQSLFIED